MNTFGLAILFGCAFHTDMNTTDNKNPIFRLDFPTDIGRQTAFTCVNFARLQRAPEGSEHSAPGRGHNIIQGCRV